MKSTVKAVVLLTLSFTLFGAVLARAQYTLPPFQHVIIVIQENRTPDNLFGAGATSTYTQTLPALGTGVDLALSPENSQPWCLGACFDPGHGNSDWQAQDGLLNGNPYNACANSPGLHCASTTCNAQPVCTSGQSGCTAQYTLSTCPQETYVSPTYDEAAFSGTPPIYPYFDIAHKYGFANYFFQTNQGPSQPAHDFLFGGTSAPAGSSTQSWYGSYWQDFVSGNPGSNQHQTDCDYASGQTVPLVNPSATSTGSEPPCFDHLTMADLLTSNGYSWRYYTNDDYDLWTAPSGIAHLCYGSNWVPSDFPYPCKDNSGYTAVVTPTQNFFADVEIGGTNLPGGNGHGECQLPNVAWIVPNGAWSDHPGVSNGSSVNTEYGPDWVGSIINAVGSATCVDETGNNPWKDTVIFVVWDDWGGFHDHVGAGLGTQYLGDQNNGTSNGCFFPTNWGCGYSYGFRVPFLVVSGYTSDGYVSGACTQGGTCYPPNGNGSANAAPYQHDFGSILGFIENNFGLGIGAINSADCPDPSSTTCSLFADNYYPERQAETGPFLPLGDFFDLWSGSENYNSALCAAPQVCPKNFESIQLAGSYNFNYFQNYSGPVLDPDNDAIDPQN
jgi:hypothetical protein